jgi:maleamate amidohydrolase
MDQRTASNSKVSNAGGARYADSAEVYAQRGFGVRLGGGKKPAYVVVDLAKAFTDPKYKLGWDLTSVLDHTREILDVMRSRGQLVVFLTVALEPEMMKTVACQKIPANLDLRVGSREVEIDDRLGRRENEPLVVKQYFSGFFGTSLSSLLINRGIDTILLGGTSTSGCVRATAMDGIALGFRPLVVRECCGDRSQEAHNANLFDIDQKYGDVISHAEALDYVKSV